MTTMPPDKIYYQIIVERLVNELTKVDEWESCDDYYHHYCGCGYDIEDIVGNALIQYRKEIEEQTDEH